MKKVFPKLSVRDICLLGLFFAITALLSIFCTFRIGTIVKIPLKFVSVFVAAALYGPIWGGVCGAVGDILNCLLAPVGPFVPQITVLEFLSGVIYGIFFFAIAKTNKTYFVRCCLCVLCQLLLSAFLCTFIYTYWLRWFPGFWEAFIIRLPAALVNFILQFSVLLSLKGLIFRLKGGLQ